MTDNLPLKDELPNEIKKLEYKLLLWEKRFEEKYGRKPCIADIQKRPSIGVIEILYKDYNRAKKRWLQIHRHGKTGQSPPDPISQPTSAIQAQVTESSNRPSMTVSYEPSINHPLSPHRHKVMSPSLIQSRQSSIVARSLSVTELDTNHRGKAESAAVNTKQLVASPRESRANSPTEPSFQRHNDTLSSTDITQTFERQTKNRRLDRNDPIVRRRKAKFALALSREAFRYDSMSPTMNEEYDVQNSSAPEMRAKQDNTLSPNMSPNRLFPNDGHSSSESPGQPAHSFRSATGQDSDYPHYSPLTDRQRRFMEISSSQPELSSETSSQQATDDEIEYPMGSPCTALQPRVADGITFGETLGGSPQDDPVSPQVCSTRTRHVEIVRSTPEFIEMLKEDQKKEELENEAFWLDISVQELQRRKYACQAPLNFVKEGGTDKND